MHEPQPKPRELPSTIATKIHSGGGHLSELSDLVDGSITLPYWFHSFYPQTRVSDILDSDPCLRLHGKRVIHTTFRTSSETGNSPRFLRGSAHSTHVEPVSNRGCESDTYNGPFPCLMYRLTFTLSPVLVFHICPQLRPDLLPVNDVYRAVQLDR